MSDRLEIHALADEQLTAEEKARVQERLAGCEQSQRELRAIQAVKEVIASRRDTVTCEETWKRCQHRLDAMDKVHRIEGFVGKYAWALCSVFLVAIIGAGMLNRNRTSFGATEVPRMAANLTPFLSSPSAQDTRTQQRFIDQTAGRGQALLQARGARVKLIQGAAAEVEGHRVVRFDLRDDQGVVTLYAIEDATVGGLSPVPGNEDYSYAPMNDTNLVSWQDGDYSVLLQSRRSVDDLVTFAETVCQQ